MEAAANGNISLLDRLLQSTLLDVNIAAGDGSTALHCAARGGHATSIHYLLQRGADLERFNEQRKKTRPLHEAIIGKRPEAVAALLEAKADITVRDSAAFTIFDYIARSGDVAICQTFLQKAPAKDPVASLIKPLYRSAINADAIKILRYLLDHYPDTLYSFENSAKFMFAVALNTNDLQFAQILLDKYKASVYLATMNIRGRRPLHMAARRNSVDVLKLLLDHTDIDVNVFSSKGSTALHIAANHGHTEAVKCLLKMNHVDINATDRRSYTPLHLAAKNGHVDTVSCLLRAKNIMKRPLDGYHYTPWVTAFYNLRWDVLTLLARYDAIDSGFEIGSVVVGPEEPILDGKITAARIVMSRHKFRHDDWERIIKEMAKSGAVAFAKWLLEQPEFDVNKILHTYDESETVLQIATRHHQQAIFNLFLQDKRIKPNTIDWKGQSVLHYTVKYDNMPAFQFLLARKDIDLTIRDWVNETALDISIRLGRTEMIQILKAHGAPQHRTKATEPTMDSRMQIDQPSNTTESEGSGQNLDVIAMEDIQTYRFDHGQQPQISEVSGGDEDGDDDEYDMMNFDFDSFVQPSLALDVLQLHES